MRQLKAEELEAIASLYAADQQTREIQQLQRRALVPLGQPLPIMHQVLFS
jgi:hypothetical protein